MGQRIGIGVAIFRGLIISFLVAAIVTLRHRKPKLQRPEFENKPSVMNKPYLRAKGELKAEERQRYEPDVGQSPEESDGDNEIHELFIAKAGGTIIRQGRQEFRGEEVASEFDIKTNLP